jgi:hypothetical protein
MNDPFTQTGIFGHANEREEECIEIIGGKARRKETSRRVKT